MLTVPPCATLARVSDLDDLAAAGVVALDGAFARLANDRPPADEVLRRWPSATPYGRVMLALLLDPERGRHALATLALDPAVAADVRPMLANEATYAAPPAPRPSGAEDVLARRFEAALAELSRRAGVPVEAAEPLPSREETERIEASLRERTVFAPGLLDLATRRAVEVTPDGGPAPGDLDALCPEMQRVLDAATRADLPAVPATAGYPGRRGVLLPAPLRMETLPDGVTYLGEPTPHEPYTEYRCTEHHDYVLCAVG